MTFQDLTPEHRRGVYWGFFWRSLVVAIGATLGGAVVGGVIGFFAAILGRMFGYDPAATLRFIRIVAGGAGLVVGLIAWGYFVRWIFRSKFGPYTIRLMRAEDSVSGQGDR